MIPDLIDSDCDEARHNFATIIKQHLASSSN